LGDLVLVEAGTKLTGAFIVHITRFEASSGIDSRQKLYEFFMSLKQPDGSFLVAEHMEVDVR
jgi:protein farnesyltransferase subunit beta